MTNNALFAALYRGFYEHANTDERAALLDYVISTIAHWNTKWGDGSFDHYSNRLLHTMGSKEKIFLAYFGRDSKILYGKYKKEPATYYSLSALANFDFDLLPSPNLIIERHNGQQYYLYRLEDFDKVSKEYFKNL